MWRSAITTYREELTKEPNVINPIKCKDDWKMYAIEHPNNDMRFRPEQTFDAQEAKKQLHSLYHPLKLFSPVKAAKGCGRDS